MGSIRDRHPRVVNREERGPTWIKPELENSYRSEIDGAAKDQPELEAGQRDKLELEARMKPELPGDRPSRYELRGDMGPVELPNVHPDQLRR